MFEQITKEAAQDQDWDVIIAGSSFAAMFFLKGLPEDTRVLIVEKGQITSHADQLTDGELADTAFEMENSSDHEKTWVAKTAFGGNSNCWWGQVPRFHPSDFRLFETHGVGAPWPVSYDDIAPYYSRVEEIMEVAGGGNEAILPRDTPFLYPAQAPSRSDSRCMQERPDIWVPVPTARSNGGSRPSCCGNGVCNLCPVDAKFTVLNGIDAFSRPNVALLVGAGVASVTQNGGQATGVRLESGEVIQSGAVALATNAINNAAILLRSGQNHAALGRYLHEQSSVTFDIDTEFPGYFGGSSVTGHCYAFYDGPWRDQDAAVLIENYNAPPSLRHERGKWTHRMKLKLIAEDLPRADNRVELTSEGAPLLRWNGHADYAMRGLRRAHAGLADVIPGDVHVPSEGALSTTEAHIQGTHRMGDDPAQSVVDGSLRVHGMGNLFAVGAGAFPTASPANPTLTLSALALRAGESL